MARRKYRDEPVLIGNGISVLSGGFELSGGSRKSPIVGRPKKGTVLLIREFPKTKSYQLEEIGEIKSFDENKSKWSDHSTERLLAIIEEIKAEVESRG